MHDDNKSISDPCPETRAFERMVGDGEIGEGTKRHQTVSG